MVVGVIVIFQVIFIPQRISKLIPQKLSHTTCDRHMIFPGSLLISSNMFPTFFGYCINLLSLSQMVVVNMGVSIVMGVPKKLDGFCSGKSHLEMDDLGVPS